MKSRNIQSRKFNPTQRRFRHEGAVKPLIFCLDDPRQYSGGVHHQQSAHPMRWFPSWRGKPTRKSFCGLQVLFETRHKVGNNNDVQEYIFCQNTYALRHDQENAKASQTQIF